jgi:hypothetical protein
VAEDYCTLEQLKKYIGLEQGDQLDDETLTSALDSVHAGVEDFTGRVFTKEDTATARLFEVDDCGVVEVDDFHTDAGLIVETDDGLNGSYSTTWAAGDYQLEPLNGVHHGRSGWPFTTIRAVGSRRFPRPRNRRATVRITAAWGWAAVPAPVHQACLILGAEAGKLKDAPFGVAGFADYGPIRVRDNPIARAKLTPYARLTLGIA